MRSYSEHLRSTANRANFMGVFRASAIFPVIERAEISTRLLFVGYWILKRKIAEIGRVATLRNQEGEILKRTFETICEPKAFQITAQELLPEALKGKDFIGSLEVEFFSSYNLVFPYPAVVVNYYGDLFSTVVHTAQRVYNNFEDAARNSITQVSEAGFNCYEGQGLSSFVALVNGPLELPQRKLEIEAINWKNEVKKETLPLGTLKPYQTVWVHPGKELNLAPFFAEKPGTCKLGFELEGIFPRLIVGNEADQALTITHTYYDCSQATSVDNYWSEESPLFHAASLMIPVDLTPEAFTNVYFYPIYSPAPFAIDIEIYDGAGKRVAEVKEALHINPKVNLRGAYQKFTFSDLQLPPAHYSAKLVARKLDNHPIPSRIKIGLDLGYKNCRTPSNICTNLQPYTAQITNKATSFKWAPILADQPRSSLWLLNSSPQINYDQTATIDLQFHREQDSTVLERPIILPPQGFIHLEIEKDPELKHFFGNKVGWATMVTNAPFLTTYYFAINPSGYVGGDHGF